MTEFIPCFFASITLIVNSITVGVTYYHNYLSFPEDSGNHTLFYFTSALQCLANGVLLKYSLNKLLNISLLNNTIHEN